MAKWKPDVTFEAKFYSWEKTCRLLEKRKAERECWLGFIEKFYFVFKQLHVKKLKLT